MMTEREELFLYQGIMIGTVIPAGSEPPNWLKPWIADIYRKYDDQHRNSLAEEVKNTIIAAATDSHGGNN